MNRFVASLALLVLGISGPAWGDAECSVPTEEVSPVAIPLEERAAHQDESCGIILSRKSTIDDGRTGDGCKDEVELLNKAVAFCTDPTDLAVTIDAQELERARIEIEAGADTKCSTGDKGVAVQSSLPLGLGFQDDLIRGLAKFVVARAKAEAMAWLITRLKDKLCKDHAGKQLVPASCALLADATADGTAPMAWGTLKAAFEHDLQRLPERAAACVASQAGAPAGVADLLYGGIQAGRLVHEGEDPMEVVAGFVDAYPMTGAGECAAQPGQCALHLLGYTVRLLAPLPPEEGADATAPLPVWTDEARFFKIVARRWWDHAKALQLVSTELSSHVQDALARLRQLHRGVRALAEAVKAARAELKTVTEDKFRFQAVAELTRATVGVLEAAFALVPDGHLSAEVRARVEAGLAVVDELAAALDDVLDREYGQVLVKVVLASGAIAAEVAATKFDRTTLSSTFRKYAPFVTEVASAKTPEDVQRALESAAAPVGGGLAKRGKARRTVAVTAFLGGQIGREHVEAPDGASTWGTHGGIFAPVGVDVSWGVSDCISLGGFLSLIDLGALASFRTAEEVETADGTMAAEVESTPEIGLRQVLAPGAYFVIGIDRFAIGIGGSMTPELRRITADGTLVEEAAAFRLGVFASIDVTIFPF